MRITVKSQLTVITYILAFITGMAIAMLSLIVWIHHTDLSSTNTDYKFVACPECKARIYFSNPTKE